MIVKAQTAVVSHTVVADDRVVHVPEWVADLASFRRWYHSDEFPEDGRICFLKREVWVDMSKEQVFTHTKVKGEFTRVLGNLLLETPAGDFFPDGLRLSHGTAGLSCVPDGTLILQASWQAGRVQLVEGAREGFIEVEGTPDMVLEIVSPSSEEKDYTTLRELYWQAGITEYWLVDVRGDRLDFDILRHGAKAYAPVRKQGGWVKSKVFGKAFRLSRSANAVGHPAYRLEAK